MIGINDIQIPRDYEEMTCDDNNSDDEAHMGSRDEIFIDSSDNLEDMQSAINSSENSNEFVIRFK
jgi:hypothetical protein